MPPRARGRGQGRGRGRGRGGAARGAAADALAALAAADEKASENEDVLADEGEGDAVDEGEDEGAGDADDDGPVTKSDLAAVLDALQQIGESQQRMAGRVVRLEGALQERGARPARPPIDFAGAGASIGGVGALRTEDAKASIALKAEEVDRMRSTVVNVHAVSRVTGELERIMSKKGQQSAPGAQAAVVLHFYHLLSEILKGPDDEMAKGVAQVVFAIEAYARSGGNWSVLEKSAVSVLEGEQDIFTAKQELISKMIRAEATLQSKDKDKDKRTGRSSAWRRTRGASASNQPHTRGGSNVSVVDAHSNTAANPGTGGRPGR
jgi:hypothetical protein